jgi:outer membrane protein
MQTYFGVSADQATRSGLPEFTANAGVDSLRLSAGAAYRAAPRWRVVGIYSLARLQGDAAASPIIETRTQNSFFVSAIYLLR